MGFIQLGWCDYKTSTLLQVSRKQEGKEGVKEDLAGNRSAQQHLISKEVTVGARSNKRNANVK